MTVVFLTDHSWEAMVAKAADYVPIIIRLVGFKLLHDHRTNLDHDPTGSIAIATVPGLKDLSQAEQEFVFAGASESYYQEDPRGWIEEMILAWVESGAPS